MELKTIAFTEIRQEPLVLTEKLVRTLIRTGEYHTSVFNKELSLFFAQEPLGGNISSFQLLCYLDRTFVGYAYVELSRTQLRITRNNVLEHTGSYPWSSHIGPYSALRIEELNRYAAYAMYIEPGFRRNTEGSIYKGFGALLLRGALHIGIHLRPETRTLVIEALQEKLPFYEGTLGFRMRRAYLSKTDIIIKKEFRRTLERTGRTAILTEQKES